MTLKKLLGIVILFSVSQTLWAAGKIVTFDHQQAMLETDFAKKRIEALKQKSEFVKLQANLESLRADLQSMAKEQESKGMTWSQQQLAEHRKNMEYIQADLQLAQKKIQAETSAVLGQIAQELEPKLESVLKKVIESEKIDVVLKKQAVYFASPKQDISGKVTEMLDKEM